VAAAAPFAVVSRAAISLSMSFHLLVSTVYRCHACLR
jgi:hypothetical protein